MVPQGLVFHLFVGYNAAERNNVWTRVGASFVLICDIVNHRFLFRDEKKYDLERIEVTVFVRKEKKNIFAHKLLC